MTHLELRLLGPFQVMIDGKAIISFESNRVRGLLCLLAAEAPRPQFRESLAEMLWPGWPQQSAMTNLRSALADLRKNLGDREAHPPFLHISRETIQLNLESEVWVDTLSFLHSGDVELYRGPFLEGFGLADSPAFTEWLLSKRAYYQQQVLAALGRHAERCEQAGEFEQGLEYARRQLEIEPWLEEAHRQVMRLLAQSGKRSMALAQFETCRQLLEKELGAVPSEETRQLSERISLGEWPGSRAQVGEMPAVEPEAQPRHNLPAQLTSFIGRTKEINEIGEFLDPAMRRLVTLTGSGGVGKTRLALQVAEKVLDRFPDGVWWVELAPIGDVDLVSPTIAQVLGLREVPGVPILDSLCGYLKSRRLLLILDNCEHILTACASMVDTLLKRCPKLQILATSREILNVPGETSFRVPSLHVPDTQKLPPFEQLAQSESVRLFVERAAQAAPGFLLDEANAPAVVTICRRLDGIPLAIELAAARVRVMPVAQITTRLENVFRLLMGGARTVMPRQQTLKATIDWSYALLSPQERVTLQRLSAFSGGWTLEAAEAVCAGGEIETDEVLDLLAGLLDKSLVILSILETGEGRYRMLETIHQYARDRLLEAGGGEDVRDRHLMYFMEWSEQIEPRLRGPEQIECLDLLEYELDNSRLALEWSLVGHMTQGLRLASALKWFWHITTKGNEGYVWLERLLTLEAEGRGNQPLTLGVHSESHLRAWSRSVNAISLLCAFQGIETRRWIDLEEENVRLCRRMGDSFSRELVWALLYLGELTFNADPCEEGLRISREKGYRYEEVEFLWALFHISAFWKYESQKGQTYLEQSLAICMELQDVDGIATSLQNSGLLALLVGDKAKAKTLIEQGVEFYRRAKNTVSVHRANVYLLCLSLDIASIARAEKALVYFMEMQNFVEACFAFGQLIYAEWEIGNFERARHWGEQGLEYYSRTNHKKSEDSEWIPLAISRLAMSQGDFLQARSHFKNILLVILESHNHSGTFSSGFLDGLAIFFVLEGDLDRGMRLFGAGDEMYQTYEATLLPREHSEHEEALLSARQALGEDGFAAAWEAGRAMSLEQALAYALAGLETEPDVPGASE